METEFSSEGARLLAELMRSRGWGRADVATVLTCDVSMVRRWLNGQRLPDLHTAAKVEAILGIPCAAWTVPCSKSAA
jgi:ribosome-binding protein aMBF1 (putative translation factor)